MQLDSVHHGVSHGASCSLIFISYISANGINHEKTRRHHPMLVLEWAMIRD